MAKTKWNIVRGIVITLIFLGLLVVRLELFKEHPVENPVSPKAKITRAPESWMNIYQNKKKIGVIHRKFNVLEDGHFQTSENVTMRINTMGITQALHISTDTELNSNMTLSSFNFELNSSLFRFTARGYMGKDKIVLYAGLPHAEEKT